MRLFSVFLTLLVTINSIGYCQELKKKKKLKGDYLEEYFVLKEDKKVKHGQYVKYRINILDRKGIETIGFYNNGKRAGSWFFFSLNGYLEKEGQYANDKKVGLWTEYYKFVVQDSNTINAINSSLEVNKGITITEEGEIIVARNKLQKSSEGVYQNDAKIGAWKYYALDGSLVHVFDHSSSKLLVRNDKDSVNSICPFLGGLDRFFNEYRKHNLTHPKEPTKISLEINSEPFGLSLEIISLSGNKQFAEDVKLALRKMANEFLFVDDEPLRLKFESEGYTGGMFSKVFIYFGDKTANKTYE